MIKYALTPMLDFTKDINLDTIRFSEAIELFSSKLTEKIEAAERNALYREGKGADLSLIKWLLCDSGAKISYISEYVGLSRQTLYNIKKFLDPKKIQYKNAVLLTQLAYKIKYENLEFASKSKKKAVSNQNINNSSRLKTIAYRFLGKQIQTVDVDQFSEIISKRLEEMEKKQ